MIAEYGFNKDQARAFECLAAAFFHEYVKRFDLDAHQLAALDACFIALPKNKHLIMALMGEGGTGKSEVINAFRELTQRWGAPEALRVSATTGSAATLIHGATWQSATGSESFKRSKTEPKSCSNDQLVRDWRTITVLIIDEVSMMSAKDIHYLDMSLKLLKNNDRPFGGVHVAFSGDFCQLAPVKAATLYESANYPLEAPGDHGRDLWKKLNTVVILSENFRAITDPRWAALLSRLRLKTPTDDDLDMLRKLMTTQQSQTRTTAHDAKDEKLVIVPDNNTMELINKQYARLNQHKIAGDRKTSWKERGVLIIDAAISSAQKKKESAEYRSLKSETLRKLREYVPQKQLGKKKAMRLRILFGTSRYMITENRNVAKGVANGMQVNIH